MDKSTPIMIILGLTMILFVVIYVNSLPSTIEGKVVFTDYKQQYPPWTEISFSTLGGEPKSIRLSGHIELKTGSTYRITYATPIWHLWADPIEIIEIIVVKP